MGETALFNTSGRGKAWDNFIVGGAYQRDLWYRGPWTVAAEMGVADRFGKYDVCCQVIVRTSLVHSGELWGGIALRHEGVVLFSKVRLSAGGVFGFSAITKSIGGEREHEIASGGSARFLFYVAGELTISDVTIPNYELVMRLHHRSGAWGTFGSGAHEGYNGWVFGLRHRF